MIEIYIGGLIATVLALLIHNTDTSKARRFELVEIVLGASCWFILLPLCLGNYYLDKYLAKKAN